MVEWVKGPVDCKKSHFSAFEIEERIRDIEGVLDVSGDHGEEIEFAEKIKVTVDSKYRGTEMGEQMRTEIERLAGFCNVKYEWRNKKVYNRA